MDSIVFGGRQSGRTTKQMLDAPKNALFVWCSLDTRYAKHLANQLGRSDLEIVGRNVFSNIDKIRGKRFSGIILDHAIDLPSWEYEDYLLIKSYCCYK